MSNLFTDVLEEQKTEMLEGDYIGSDGLIHCGKCGSPKQTKQEMPPALQKRFGKYKLLPILCECETQKAEAERSEAEEIARRAAIEKVRFNCFPFEGMQKMDFAHDDMEDNRTSTICRRYVERFDEFEQVAGGLMFYGPVGTGKSYHAAAIANAVIDTGRTALFTSLSTLGNRMGANYGHDKQKVLDELCSYDLVVLDDLGIERSTPAMNENVYQIINALYMNKTVIICTTNMEPKEMSANLDPNAQRIYSRVLEACRPVKVAGSDKRRRKSQEKDELYRALVEG